MLFLQEFKSEKYINYKHRMYRTTVTIIHSLCRNREEGWASIVSHYSQVVLQRNAVSVCVSQILFKYPYLIFFGLEKKLLHPSASKFYVAVLYISS